MAAPVIAILLSTAFEGYHLTPVAVAGAVCAMLGLLVALADVRRRETAGAASPGIGDGLVG